MKHPYSMRLSMFVLLLLASSVSAWANLGDYRFTAIPTGSYNNLSGGTLLIAGTDGTTGTGTYNQDAVAGSVPIGFTFYFDGQAYTTFSLNPHGLMILGTNTSTSRANRLGAPPVTSDPIIAPFWDEQHMYNGLPTCSAPSGVSYALTGSPGSRVLTVEWRTQLVSGGTYWFTTANSCSPMLNYQVRFYECSNIIEYHYGWFRISTNTGVNSTASIGFAKGNGNFLSVTPAGTSATVSTTTADDNVNNNNALASDSIRYGMIYRFEPNNLVITGRLGTGNGGTATMASGDNLLTGQNVQLGNSAVFQPFSLSSVGTGCPATSFTVAITGSTEYFFGTPGTQTFSGSASGATPVIPAITFAPSGQGTRMATLTVTDNTTGASRTFYLAGTGTARIRYIGNIAEGGTAAALNGDSLLLTKSVLRGTSSTFRPITVQNANLTPNFSSAPVTVTASIDSAGFVSSQYRLVDPTTGALVTSYTKSLAPGDTFAPRIHFLALGAGPQMANLNIVTSDNENRLYRLGAISAAPSGQFIVDGSPLAGREMFGANTNCVNAQATTIPVVVTNTGYGDLIIRSFEAYELDTTYQQGTPTLPFRRDAQGRLVPLTDYSLTLLPGTAPTSTSTPITFPFAIPQGQSQTIYLTYVPTQAGKRFAQIYIRTNALNFSGVDTSASPMAVEGMINVLGIGRSVGSMLASTTSGLKLRPILFPHTRVGDTSIVAFTVANAGACDLRINRGKLRIFSGDVNEFTLMSSLRNAQIDGTTGDYILAPGTVDTLRVRFTPSRAGTRMATIWIQTNDSTISTPGIAERGAYYLDLHGRGLAGLDGSELVLAPVVIGSSVDGTAILENTQTIAVGIDRIFFEGGDAAEFSSVNWPTTPSTVLPGAKLALGVRLTPAAGSQAGSRRTTIAVVTSFGDTVRVGVRGEAGTQTLVVSPTSMFDNVTIAIGQASRQLLQVSNTGTLPVRITSLMITGVDSLAYRLGNMPRRDLEPGQTEYVEVTFIPTATGQMSAQIELRATDGQLYTVALGGTAFRVRRDPTAPPTQMAPGNDGTPERRADDERPLPTLR
jgi:hypothetical protein